MGGHDRLGDVQHPGALAPDEVPVEISQERHRLVDPPGRMRFAHPRLDLGRMAQPGREDLFGQARDRRSAGKEAFESMLDPGGGVPVTGGQESRDVPCPVTDPSFDLFAAAGVDAGSKPFGLLPPPELGPQLIDHPHRGVEVAGGDVLFHQHPQQFEFPIAIDQSLGLVGKHRVFFDAAENRRGGFVVGRGSTPQEHRQPDREQCDDAAGDRTREHRRGPGGLGPQEGGRSQQRGEKDRRGEPGKSGPNRSVGGGFHDPGTTPPPTRVRGTRQMNSTGSEPVLRN